MKNVVLMFVALLVGIGNVRVPTAGVDDPCIVGFGVVLAWGLGILIGNMRW